MIWYCNVCFVTLEQQHTSHPVPGPTLPYESHSHSARVCLARAFGDVRGMGGRVAGVWML